MKSLDKALFRSYDRFYPYFKHFRGATRLHKVLMRNWLSNEVKSKYGYFVSEYNGIKIKSKEFLDQRDLYVEKLIDSYLFGYELEEGDTIIMAGAYPGMFVSYAGKKVGQEGKVIALEPDPDNYERLEENIRLNSLQNIEVLQKAVYNEEKTIRFKKGDGHGSRIAEEGEHSVETVVLDSFQNLEPGLVVMDIEGAEIEALEGAEELISNSDTRFAIRSYHMRKGEPTARALERLGYRLGREPYTRSKYPIEKTTYL